MNGNTDSMASGGETIASTPGVSTSARSAGGSTKAFTRDDYINLNDELCSVRDLMRVIELAAGMVSDIQAGSISRVADIAIERLDQALDRLEKFEPVPNVIRKEMA